MKIKSMLTCGLTASVLTGLLSFSFIGSAFAEWKSSSPVTVLSREEGSGTRGAFVELFDVLGLFQGKKADLTTADAQITNSTSVMLTTVAGDEYAIGYISLGALNDKVKAVKIDNILPSIENIQNGTYTISRPFNIAVNPKTQNAAAEDFIAFILSAAGQKLVEKAGYIPAAGQKEFVSAKPKGKAVVGGSSSVSPVMEKLLEAYKLVNPDADLELQVTDSTTGMISVINGNYDIGLASRELKSKELEQGLKPIVIAIDGIAVIVNKNNRVESLSKEAVKSIYSGDIKTWAEVLK